MTRLAIAATVLLFALLVLLVVAAIWPRGEPAAEPVAAAPDTAPSTATSTTMATVVVPPPPVVVDDPPHLARSAPTSISSTAYCETGHMANGVPAHDGAVSSKVLPRGSSWLVLDGPLAGRTFTVEDTGPLAFFDVAMPGRCADALVYGRHQILIEAA